MMNVDENEVGEARSADALDREPPRDESGPGAGVTGVAGGPTAGGGRPARRRRTAGQPFGMSSSVWQTITAMARHIEQVQTLERMASSAVVRQSMFTAEPVVRQLLQPPLVTRLITPMVWTPPVWTPPVWTPPVWTSPAVDLLRATLAWPSCSAVTLVRDSTRQFWASITQSLSWRLDLWAGQQGLEGRLLLAVASQVREHLLSDDAGDRGPVEEFTFEWLGYARPERAQERESLLEAVIDVLLGATWPAAPARVRRLLRREVDATRRSTRPFWERTINGRRVISCDLPVPSLHDPDGATLISLQAGHHDVERDALDRMPGTEADPAVRWLMLELTAEEMAVVWHYVDGGITWRQAASLCGQDERLGESIRRKVKRLVHQHQAAVARQERDGPGGDRPGTRTCGTVGSTSRTRW
ncbi:hypothetical protein ACIRG5_19050 [Lentzea sp. NPDC102401]|uniref:hypothetical protein n=1 Tax=Lentzea sp. NPDC102401 TaxID=3364128 RepID=UPI003806E89F